MGDKKRSKTRNSPGRKKDPRILLYITNFPTLFPDLFLERPLYKQVSGQRTQTDQERTFCIKSYPDL